MVAGRVFTPEMEVRPLLPQPSLRFFRKEEIAETTTAVGVAEILENTSTIGTVVGSTWDIMTANPLLLLFLCASIVSLGFAFYKKAKRAARG